MRPGSLQRAAYSGWCSACKDSICLQGKYVVLFFYPLDFTFVCPTEITAFSDRHGDFKSKNAEVHHNHNLWCHHAHCAGSAYHCASDISPVCGYS